MCTVDCSISSKYKLPPRPTGFSRASTPVLSSIPMSHVWIMAVRNTQKKILINLWNIFSRFLKQFQMTINSISNLIFHFDYKYILKYGLNLIISLWFWFYVFPAGCSLAYWARALAPFHQSLLLWPIAAPLGEKCQFIVNVWLFVVIDVHCCMKYNESNEGCLIIKIMVL